ncbi:MAG: type II secretion system protein [Candidatus Hydrogenedentes bacterium]|nr:type II secretion system protein [Candidatus Hydrogenedentota bacterium]
MSRPEALKRNDAGMTLIELMFACGILALAFSMIFGSLISMSVLGRVAESRTQAATVLASVMEEIRGIPFDDVLQYTPPDFEGPGVGHSITVECAAAGGSEGEGPAMVALPLAADFGGKLTNPLEVRVTITWRETSGHTFRASASVLKEK